MTLDDVCSQAPGARGKPAGMASLYYRIGDQPPVQTVTPFVPYAAGPKSLVLWFFDPSSQPVQFLLFLAIQHIYIGPGEYEGNVNDIRVGLGLADSGGSDCTTWTAGTTTSSTVTTYFVPGGSEVIGTLSVQGLVPGPVFGPPDDPPPLLPTVDILFCFFQSEEQGTESNP